MPVVLKVFKIQVREIFSDRKTICHLQDEQISQHISKNLNIQGLNLL